MKKGEMITVDIESYAFEGKGVAKIEQHGSDQKFVIFVQNTYPGDTVKAQIRKKKKRYAEAKAIEIITPSEFRTEAPCRYFSDCGGCKQQDLRYEMQTSYKAEQVADIMQRIGGFTDVNALPILPAEHIFFYRNKMEFSFADRRWLTQAEINSDKEFGKTFAVGLHAPGSFDKVIDIEECLLQSPESNLILNFTRDFFKERNTTIYSTKTHTGYLRNLVIKHSHHTGDIMVNLVTSEENDELMREYTAAITAAIDGITTVINNINTRKAQIAVGDYEIVYYGDGYIYDNIGSKRFRISANSFFQTNTLQAEGLYQKALDFAGLTGTEIVYDLYCGAGTISLFIADACKKVIGFEVVDSAIADANTNKELNGADNVEFYQADLYKSFLPVAEAKGLPKPDVILLDPPRSGMHQNTVNDVIALAPEKIVYVSCNPATQARDMKLLAEAGYRFIEFKPVDMFPQTYHIENVALMVKQ